MRMRRFATSCLLLGALILPTACGGGGGGGGGGGSDEPFVFQTNEEEDVQISVTVDGTATGGVSVTITDHLDAPAEGEEIEDLITGNTYYHGVTDENGRVDAEVRIPTSVEEVDVIVQQPGASGDFSVEALRTIWGPFSPSARLQVDRDGLDPLTIALESD